MSENGKLVAVIGDEDTVTGFVLAGTGHREVVSGRNKIVPSQPRPVQQIPVLLQHT